MGGGNLRNRGFTVVELIVSFSLTLVVILLLFQVILTLKELYVKDGLKTELLGKQSIMMQKVMTDFDHNKISQATRCGDDCFNFTFEDGHTSNLTLDRGKGIFHYGNYTTKLLENSLFGKISIKNQTMIGVATGKKDSMIMISIPIHAEKIKGNYGLHLVYQYDSRTTSIGDLNESQETTGKEQILLRGLKETVLLEGELYEEAGYFVKLEDGTTILNDARVIITGSVGTALGTYTLTYTLKNTSGTIISSIDRTVRRIPQVYRYDYTGAPQSFNTPVNGIYKVELWGAQGGQDDSENVSNSQTDLYRGANGGYTKGNLILDQNEVLYVYVGERPVNKGYAGSFNGGGAAGYSGTGGGGATDVRLIPGAWNNIEGLRSRIMVAGGGAGGYENASAAGGLVGHHRADSLNEGYGGSQTAGGTGGNTLSLTCSYGRPAKAGDGTFGMGGGSDYYGTGGGGGYYGGGGGVHYCLGDSGGAGGGGSSFISGYNGCNAIDSTGKHTNQPNHYSGKVFTNSVMIDGQGTVPNPRSSGTTIGNFGNGYARITLLAITN